MGVVFKPEQIARYELPDPGAHEKAGRFILDTVFEDNDLERLLNPNGIQAGMVYGSTALGSANIRSDLDVLFTYHGVEALEILRDVFCEVEQKYRVPVEHILVDIDLQLAAGQNRIDPLHARHLFEIQEQDVPRWSYWWPVSTAVHGNDADAYSPESVRRLAVRYCTAKSSSFSNGIADYKGEINYALYQRALELPYAIGRKVLAAVNGAETVDQSVLQNKTEIMDRLQQILLAMRLRNGAFADFDSTGTRDAFTKLAAIDHEYDELLASIDGSLTDVQEYEDWITDHYEYALELARLTATTWANILHKNLDTRNLKKEAEDNYKRWMEQLEEEAQLRVELGDTDYDYLEIY